MIARLTVLLPYYFNIPYKADLSPYEFDYQVYKVKIYPPKQANSDYSSLSIHSQEPMFSVVNKLSEKLIASANGEVKINGQETVSANLFQLDVWVEKDFNRDIDSKDSDLLVETLLSLADIHLGKLRTIGRLQHLRYINKRDDIVWKVEYLNDDGTPLEKNETKKRRYFQAMIPIKVLPLSKPI